MGAGGARLFYGGGREVGGGGVGVSWGGRRRNAWGEGEGQYVRHGWRRNAKLWGMRSPFAGMDPFLEPHWLDVHHRLVTYTSDWLNERLPADLVASTEERVAIDAGGDVVERIGPDVRVVEPGVEREHREMGGVGGGGLGMIEAPFRLVVDADEVREGFVKVLDGEGRLITVIEYVSPSNKRGEGMAAYRRKREQLLLSGVHVVEIDLVRAGNWRGLMAPAKVQAEAVSPYRAVVREGGGGVGGYVYPIGFDVPAGEVGIPLRAGDEVLKLPVQVMIEQAYERGRYGRRLDYAGKVEPELTGEERGVVERVFGGGKV